MFAGLNTCRAAESDHVLREERDKAAVPAKIHPAVRAPPVPGLRPRHAQDEGDAVPGEERARRPDKHAVAPDDYGDFEERARHDRDQDLSDRQAEVERDLSQHVQRHDHRAEVEPRVAQAGKDDRIARPADLQAPEGGRGGGHAHASDAVQ